MYVKNFVHLLNTILQSPTFVLSDNRNTLFKTQRHLHMLHFMLRSRSGVVTDSRDLLPLAISKTQKRNQILFHLGAIFNLSESLLVQLEIMKVPLMGSPYHGWSNSVLRVHMTSHSNRKVDAKVNKMLFI